MSSAAIEIPRARLSVRFARSGGPGGQNVNKVETKAEIRFVVAEADWIPERARSRLSAMCSSRLTKQGELILGSSQHRTQAQNLEECFQKLADLLREANQKPKRRVATRPTRGSRRRTAETKRRQSEKKRSRGWRGDD